MGLGLGLGLGLCLRSLLLLILWLLCLQLIWYWLALGLYNCLSLNFTALHFETPNNLDSSRVIIMHFSQLLTNFYLLEIVIELCIHFKVLSVNKHLDIHIVRQRNTNQMRSFTNTFLLLILILNLINFRLDTVLLFLKCFLLFFLTFL